MPHFSPISWLVTGFTFYLLLMMFVSIFWWMQSYKFPKINMISSSGFNIKWDWK